MKPSGLSLTLASRGKVGEKGRAWPEPQGDQDGAGSLTSDAIDGLIVLMLGFLLRFFTSGTLSRWPSAPVRDSVCHCAFRPGNVNSGAWRLSSTLQSREQGQRGTQ